MSDKEIVPKRKAGRPRKSELGAHTKGKVGRPKGTQAIINEYRDRMLASPKSAKVLDAIFDAALDPEHKNQAAAWKLVMDRVAPVSAFEQEILKSGGKSGISINITGLGTNVSIGESTDSSAEHVSPTTYEGEYTPDA
jgi:hypothetical protein